ncbi:alpha-L-fucosidase [Bacteroides fragilis]|nr:alpha-L-fucosidase [Bacteroides fragilis]
MVSQLQDLVNRYKPDLIWADGPDQINDKQWQAERTLAGYIQNLR